MGARLGKLTPIYRQVNALSFSFSMISLTFPFVLKKDNPQKAFHNFLNLWWVNQFYSFQDFITMVHVLAYPNYPIHAWIEFQNYHLKVCNSDHATSNISEHGIQNMHVPWGNFLKGPWTKGIAPFYLHVFPQLHRPIVPQHVKQLTVKTSQSTCAPIHTFLRPLLRWQQPVLICQDGE